MTKQRLEGDISNIFSEIKGIWYHKFQANIMAHHAVPGDFIVLANKKRFLFECKQCKNKSFSFDRMTQKESLLTFEKYQNNYSYLIFCFWKGRKDKSLYFLIDIQLFSSFMVNIGKKSANEKDFIDNFTIYSFEELKNKFKVMFDE